MDGIKENMYKDKLLIKAIEVDHYILVKAHMFLPSIYPKKKKKKHTPSYSQKLTWNQVLGNMQDTPISTGGYL